MFNKNQEFQNGYSNSAEWKSTVYDNVLQTIGNTPLVRLNRIPKDHGLECEIYAKCEFLNPGGSIKDRVSYTMMLDAERNGLAKPGTRFIEPTSGNTGIGVSLAAAVNGYGCTIVTPDKNSDEKMNTMHLLGADIVQTPAKAHYNDPENFMSVASRLLKENPEAISLNQYSNNINPLTHYLYTAEEILSALGNVDMIVIGAGTGGTVTGIAHKIKERCPNCVVVAVDPMGSVMFEKVKPKLFFVEGIGGDFVPDVLDKTVVDRLEKPNDYLAFNMAREVIRKEGLLCGGSSGATMYSAINAAKALKLGKGKRVVVILADGIRNYMTKFVCDQWMEAHLFKPPPSRNLPWWEQSISSLKINNSIPRLHENKSCWDALAAMNTKHSVALVVDNNGHLIGVVSKDSIRHAATNPIRGDKLNLNDSVGNHFIKKYYKIIENKESRTIGLASRILDITPFVVVVEQLETTDQDTFVPKGIITAEEILHYITVQENNVNDV